VRQLDKHIEVVSCDHCCGASILLRMALEILTEVLAISDATLEEVARAVWAAQPSVVGIWNAVGLALGTRRAD